MVKQILWGNFKPPTKNSFVLIVKIKKIPIDNKFDFKDIAFFFFLWCHPSGFGKTVTFCTNYAFDECGPWMLSWDSDLWRQQWKWPITGASASCLSAGVWLAAGVGDVCAENYSFPFSPSRGFRFSSNWNFCRKINLVLCSCSLGPWNTLPHKAVTF